MLNLKMILDEAKKELIQKDKVRDVAYQELRKATSHSKQAILLIHQKRLKDAKKSIAKARSIISRIGKVSASHPSLVYSGPYSAALQEYSEANIFLKLMEESRFITPKEIEASSEDYVLGLADVIGEYRRATLDALRVGDAHKGEQYLNMMDQIYIELMAMDESYMLISGLRRKCDVARKLIEITRGDVTQEIRRNELEKYLKKFEKYAERRK